MKKRRNNRLIALLLILCITLSFFACGADSANDNDEKNTRDKFIEYPDDVKLTMILEDLGFEYDLHTIEFPTYDDLYKFTSCVHHENPIINSRLRAYGSAFDRERFKTLTDDLFIAIQKNNDYTPKIYYSFCESEQYIGVTYLSLNEIDRITFNVYEKNEEGFANVSEIVDKYTGNREETITVGNCEILMYSAGYSEYTQKNLWYGYCVMSDCIIVVVIGSDGTKDVAAGLEMAKDFEFVPLTEYPNLEK